MMDAQILRELETAAQILLASPNLVTNEQRHAAESVFLTFKKTKSPYSLGIQILETTKVDYVMFEVAGLLKDALIREWTFLQESDIVSLRQYLLQFVTERPTLPPFVREKILQVIAIMVKRGSIDDFGQHRSHLLNEIEQLIMNGDHPRKLLACSLLSAIMQEYAVTIKSSDIGLSLEVHYKAKDHFGLKDLKRIFQFCCRALGSLASSDPPFSNEALSLLKHLLSISETVLTWDFGITIISVQDRYMIDELKSQDFPFMPPASWKDVIMDPQVVNLFFTIYWKIRMSPQLSHHALTCLVQMATVGGRRFNLSDNIEYYEHYIKGFMKLVTSVEILDREALGISKIVHKIFPSSFRVAGSPLKPYEEELYQQIILLTCNFAEGAANEETICADDRLYMEAFDHMMEVWINIMHSSIFPEGYCSQAFKQIFNVYLKCHLSPPEGTRGQGRDLELEELDESEETDRVKFKLQLQTIGGFGQNMPDHCLPLLSRLLEDRTKLLSGHMDKLFQHGPTISDSSTLVLLFEDLHWLLLIAGHVLFMENSRGQLQIPTTLMKYSVAQSSVTNVEISLRVFASPDREFNEIEDSEQKTDHILRLIAAVFRLSHVFKKFLETNLTQFLSPEVVSSLLWFLKDWSVSYLLPQESLYTELSMPLIFAFGRDSDGGVWTVNYLLEQVVAYFMHFNSEPGVSQDAVDLFISLMDSKEKCACVLKSERLQTIINIQSKLPQTVRRDVYKGLAMGAIACPDESSKNEYWQRILSPLQDRLRAIVCHENFNSIYQEEQVKTEVMEILDYLTGVALGGQSGTSEAIFQYLNPIFPVLPNLVGVYRNYPQIVELVLGFFCVCSKNLITHLTHSRIEKIYECSIQTIQTFEKCNSGRVELDAEAQEEFFNDVILLVELLRNLLPKDYLDLCNLESMREGEPTLKPGDVTLYGLNLIMPLLTANLPKHPPLCRRYFKLIVRLSEMFPEKICQLPEDFLKSILSTVELGLTTFGRDVFTLCCDFLQLIGAHICKMGPSCKPGHDALRPFLKLLIDLILSHQIYSDDMPNAGSALFAMICCYQQDYQALVQALLGAQLDPVIGDRLAKAFTALTNGVSLECEKKQKLLFASKFDEFIAKTRGFLHIK